MTGDRSSRAGRRRRSTSRSGTPRTDDRPVEGRTPPDLRLLLPALTGWALVALSLGRGPVLPGAAAVVLLVSAAAVTASALRKARRKRDHGGGAATASWPGKRPGRQGVVPADRTAGWILGLLLSSGLLVVTAGAEWRATDGPLTALAAEKAMVDASGRVMSEPRRLRATEAGPVRVAVPVQIESLRARGLTTPVRTPVLVMGGADLLDVGWRDTVHIRGRLSPGEPGQQVRAVLSTTSAPEIRAGPGRLLEGADHVREAMRVAVRPLPEDARGLVPAMVVGDRDGVPDDLADAMRATGMSHLTAVSGTNCSLVVASAMWVCGLCGVPRRVRPVVGGVVLAGFVVLARPDPSVIRAAVMGGIGLMGLLRSRRALGLPAVAGAVLVLLALDPWLARSFGFALSVIATLGLLVLARPWAETLRSRFRLGPFAEALAIPLAVQVVCAPVVVLLQGEVSIVGVLANAVVAPLVAPVTIVGAVVALIAVPFPWVAGLLAWVAALPAWGIATVARIAEDAPFRALPWRDDAAGAVVLAALLLAIVLGGRWSIGMARRHIGLVLVACALGCVALLVVSHVRSRTGFPGTDPALVMCDVGQGDAVVAMTGPGHAIIVDVGPDADLVDRCLDTLRVEAVDAVVLTHFDTDHVGGLAGVGRGRSVGDVVVSQASMSDIPRPVERWWTELGRTVHVAVQGDRFTWGRVSALVRGPRARGSGALSPNAGSLVLDLVVTSPREQDTVRALLLADADDAAGRVVETDLRACPEGPTGTGAGFDVVKVAHHGSAHQDTSLLRTSGAPVALISVGEDNRYGHPAPRLLEAVRAAGELVYRTDQDGSVALRKDDGRLLVIREHRSGA